MPQCIPEENDREFKTGPGNWEGEFTWHVDTYQGRQGYITIHIEAGQPQKTIELNYPHVKPPPSKDIIAILVSTYQATPGYHPVPEAYLTDGVYSYQYIYYATIGGWEYYGFTETLPDDWKKENSKITVTPQTLPEVTGELYLDGFSIIYEILAKTDHLPLMGVH